MGTGFTAELQQRIPDLPFEGDNLFGDKVELTLQKIKDSKLTFCVLDLKDVYTYVAICSSHKQFLRFTVGVHYFQYWVLPFDLASAPRVFTKCLAVVAAHLRQQGVFVYPYLDDWLRGGHTVEDIKLSRTHSMNLLSSLRFVRNLEKSQLVPSQKITFIGVVLDSVAGKAILPEERVYLSWKTLFLVAVTSARKIIELQVLLVHEPFTRFLQDKHFKNTVLQPRSPHSTILQPGSQNNTTSAEGYDGGVIAGGVLAGLVGIAIIAGIAYLVVKHRHSDKTKDNLFPPENDALFAQIGHQERNEENPPNGPSSPEMIVLNDVPQDPQQQEG
nr:PREDICTED: uncharacterized protein LOC106705353 [Latimeria chalumnae]|eukprot:XP_014350039.1 PREDICTED: uncharacterized protein LOC106705353 [Latimeria chalumnae]